MDWNNLLAATKASDKDSGANDDDLSSAAAAALRLSVGGCQHQAVAASTEFEAQLQKNTQLEATLVLQ